MNQPDELQKAIEEVIEWNEDRLPAILSPDQATIKIVTDAAKQLQQVEKELKQERIWKEGDPRMLREQMRVHDVAFQHLHEQLRLASLEVIRLNDLLSKKELE
jgi:threonyl-tRNA synthetase